MEAEMALNSEPKAPQLDDPARWVDRYGDAMLRFALSRVGRQEVAEDMVQEAFLAAWRARDSFDGRSSLGAWLVGILRRKIADNYRRVGREQALADVEADDQAGPLFNRRGLWLDAIAPWQGLPGTLAQKAAFLGGRGPLPG